MKCPVCKDIMLLMMDKNWVEVDYCPECRWIWLDRWELEKLIQGEQAYSNNNYQNNSHENNKNHDNHWSYQNNSNQNYKGGKKKSFLESFDFFD